MEKDLLVSIITPTFNRAYALGHTIESVRAQSYTNWEMIIVDDGSTDDTKKVVEDIRGERVVYLHQKNKGPSSARNAGLFVARGQWITYLDSDNEFLPNYIETMLVWIAKNPGALYALPKAKRTLELYENNKLVQVIDDSKDFPETLTAKDIFMRKLHFDGNGFMHARKIIDEEIRWDEGFRGMEDWDFGMQIAERHPDNFLYIPVPLVNYHQKFGGDGIVSNTSYRQWAEAFEYLYQKHKKDKLMEGQTWYPDRVQKWNKIADDYERGLVPPPHLYFFKKSS